MTMAVHDTLTCSSSYIEPDIIPGRFRGFFDYPFAVICQCHNCIFFLICQAEKIRYMAERDDQHVASGHRIPVITGIA